MKWVVGTNNKEYGIAWALIRPGMHWMVGILDGATQFDSASEAREHANDAEGDFVVPFDVACMLDSKVHE